MIRYDKQKVRHLEYICVSLWFIPFNIVCSHTLDAQLMERVIILWLNQLIPPFTCLWPHWFITVPLHAASVVLLSFGKSTLSAFIKDLIFFSEMFAYLHYISSSEISFCDNI